MVSSGLTHGGKKHTTMDYLGSAGLMVEVFMGPPVLEDLTEP